jgi:ADP-ribose pyrophosphatase YjhB (NUDIX family)
MSARGQTVKAMAVIRRPRDGALLVSEHAEPELFHRPLGGHVEFGEHALNTVHRELLEEIGQGLARVRLLGVLENIFPWGGGIGHEIVFLYAAAFSDPAAYEIDEQVIRDEAEGRSRVIWRPPDAVSPPLYPAGVPGLIATAEQE